ncbi:MAG: rubrerythrin [Firmicutes bacterium HGW-Firmicutes-16]|nr:MAG: rubrerythrin [Firmicutes bacterium HGW-Firmicutes-16]
MNVLGYAISMEMEGNKYYLNQAEINNSNGLHKIFLMLAQDEKNHEMILRNKMIESPYKLIFTDTLPNVKHILNEIGNLKSELRKNPWQLKLYKMALDKKKKSINLYSDMLSTAHEADEKELFEYLINQELQHYEILDNLIVSLSDPEEFVESVG